MLRSALVAELDLLHDLIINKAVSNATPTSASSFSTASRESPITAATIGDIPARSAYTSATIVVGPPWTRTGPSRETELRAYLRS